ncbi:MAG: hypothetical protein ACR2GD_05655 [Pyrinomonadaceae bacterium]
MNEKTKQKAHRARKEREKKESEKKNSVSEKAEKNYYYDDAHGYEIYQPNDEEQNEN